MQAQMLISGATQANLSVVWSLRKSNQHTLSLRHVTYDPDSVLIAESKRLKVWTVLKCITP